jgi:uncharacterized membrane protein YhhN
MSVHRRRIGPVVLAAATVAMVAEEVGPTLDWLQYPTKPLATLGCLALAWSARPAVSSAVRRWVVGGLAVATVGDVLLMLPREPFVAGLATFLVAHLCYIVAFTRDVPFAVRRLPFAIYAAVGLALGALLWPAAPPALRGPVGAYIVVIAVMAAQARARADTLQRRDAHAASLGAALFVVSDALIAVDRFLTDLPFGGFLILGSYWAAQWTIADAVTRRSRDDD